MNDENHPLSKFKYCPVCGSEEFKIDSFKSKKCKKCNFNYFYNASAGVPVFLRDKNDNLLLVKRKNNPAKGTLHVPGGFVDPGENAEKCAVREIKEETGLNIKESDLRYLFSLSNKYLYSDFIVTTIDIFLEGKIDSFDGAIPGDDAEDIIIVKKNDVQPEKFGLESIRKGMEMYLKMP